MLSRIYLLAYYLHLYYVLDFSCRLCECYIRVFNKLCLKLLIMPASWLAHQPLYLHELAKQPLCYTHACTYVAMWHVIKIGVCIEVHSKSLLSSDCTNVPSK